MINYQWMSTKSTVVRPHISSAVGPSIKRHDTAEARKSRPRVLSMINDDVYTQ